MLSEEHKKSTDKTHNREQRETSERREQRAERDQISRDHDSMRACDMYPYKAVLVGLPIVDSA